MLMYHSVTNGKGTPGWPWAVSMQRFRSQLDFLAAEGWATVTMSGMASLIGASPDRTVALTFDDGYIDNLPAWEELQKRGMCASWFIVSGSMGKAPAWKTNASNSDRLLNAVELRSMQASGMEIGSHTVSHVRLTEVDQARQQNELIGSKTAIEDALGNAITSFAYPYGAWDDDCALAVKNAGYHCACTTRSGWALLDGDPFRLRRLSIFNTDTVSGLARKLALGANDVSWPQVTRYALQRTLAKITPQ